MIRGFAAFFFAALITAGIVVLGLYDRDPAPATSPVSDPAETQLVGNPVPEQAPDTPTPDSATVPVAEPATRPVVQTSPDPHRSPLADRLNSPDTTISDDIGIVRNILSNYVMEIGANPVGSNREITAQLSGRNSSRHAPLPDGHAAISAAGELLDRWGTPFFFHAMSAQQMSIRSAGPDLELYTHDDAEWSPMPAAISAPATEQVIAADMQAAAEAQPGTIDAPSPAETAAAP